MSPKSTPRVRTLLLVRHCQAASQHPDAPLTDVGFGQAQGLAEFLRDYPIDFIAASRCRRARQTIEPYAGSVGLPVYQERRLNERVLSAAPIPDWEQLVRDSFDDADLCAPGGESAAGVLRRARAALDDILVRDHRLPLVVTHGNVMALLLHSVDGTFGYSGWKSLTNPDVYMLREGSDGRRSFERVWP